MGEDLADVVAAAAEDGGDRIAELGLEKKRLGLCKFVRDAIQTHQSYADKTGVTFSFLPCSGEIFSDFDPDRLIRVMASLLSNTAKFSQAGQTVEIRVLRDDEHRMVRVEIEDHGCGIAREDQARIFKPFTQADSTDQRQRGGTGLGLSLARELVEMHGGHLGLASHLGTGSTFYFELPIVTAGRNLPETAV